MSLAGLAGTGWAVEEPRSLLLLATPEAAEAWSPRPFGQPTHLRTLLAPAELGPLGAFTVRPLLHRPAADIALAAELGLDRALVLDLPAGTDVTPVAQSLREHRELFEGVWIDHVTSLHSRDGDPTPDDPYFPEQYNLCNTGQIVDGRPGLPGADINVAGAWPETLGGADVIVAILDAGISRSHPDLAGRLVPGWNCLEHNYQTDDQYTSHGTHVAGIIAAATDNGAGVAGIGWGTRLMPIVVVNRYGFGSESVLAEGLVWAADHGARVASVSLGFNPPNGSDDDQVLHAAVQYATRRGMLICASSGNTPGADIGAPARYPETIAVGATDHRDELWSGTSTGPEMGLVAPGLLIWSTWDSIWRDEGENTFAQKTGTSQACPHAAGAAALVLSVNPALSPEEAKAILEATAVDLGPAGWDEAYGAGRIDAGAAVRAAANAQGELGLKDAVCVADFNNDGSVDTQDIVSYLDAFVREGRRADIAEPFGVVNVQDLIAFLNAHTQGCEP